MSKNTFGEHAWAIEEETIAKLPPGTFSVGIGNDLVKQSGFTHQEILSSFGPLILQLIDGGANKLHMNHLDVYARRRGKAVDLGTRRDFDDLGWSAVCDVLDRG